MKYSDFVNIKQGTASVHRFSNGNTLPLVQLPFAMCGFSAQTRFDGGWFYHPNDRSLEGVRLTHQPSPWIKDYGTFLFAPQTDKVYDSFTKGWSSYRPEEAVMTPSYMKLRFLRSKADFELTPTVRGAKARLTFPKNTVGYFSVYSVKGKNSFKVDFERNCLFAWTDGKSGGKAKKFKTYLIVKFAEPIDKEKTRYGKSGAKGKDACVHIAFNCTQVNVDIATSYISFAQAQENMKQDCSDKSFEEIKNSAETQWEEYLSRIEIDSDDEKQMKTFYSCMYRTGLFPHKAYEIDKSGETVHYCPSDGSVKRGVRYTDCGFWDTYRTQFPLLALIGRDEYAQMLEGFIADYTEGGWLPRWPSIGERGCMPSSLLDAVIADAAVKGIIGGELLEKAYEGMIHHANNACRDTDYGREGVREYLKYGYVPKDKFNHSVNLTLDADYGNFCIAQVAKVLGKDDDAAEYMRRTVGYRRLFDKESGFMRGRTSDGKMTEPFDPFEWGGDYTEGCAWQSSFAVPHDIDGLAELYGGKDNLIKKLDELFETPPVFRVGAYRSEIHEMSEMAAADFGQCAISNQPSFHIPYLYAALGQTEKTEYWVKRICREAFSFEDDGFPGDEDNGSMAAWYILSTLGIYDICPGKNEYIHINKLVKSAKILGKEI